MLQTDVCALQTDVCALQREARIKKGGPSTPAPEMGKEKALDEPNAGYI